MASYPEKRGRTREEIESREGIEPESVSEGKETKNVRQRRRNFCFCFNFLLYHCLFASFSFFCLFLCSSLVILIFLDVSCEALRSTICSSFHISLFCRTSFSLCFCVEIHSSLKTKCFQFAGACRSESLSVVFSKRQLFFFFLSRCLLKCWPTFGLCG